MRRQGRWIENQPCISRAILYNLVMMTRLLQKAIDRVRELPEDEQEAVAAVMLQMAGTDAPLVQLDEETRAAVREGIRQGERGEFVADEVVAESNKRRGL